MGDKVTGVMNNLSDMIKLQAAQPDLASILLGIIGEKDSDASKYKGDSALRVTVSSPYVLSRAKQNERDSTESYDWDSVNEVDPTPYDDNIPAAIRKSSVHWRTIDFNIDDATPVRQVATNGAAFRGTIRVNKSHYRDSFFTDGVTTTLDRDSDDDESPVTSPTASGMRKPSLFPFHVLS